MTSIYKILLSITLLISGTVVSASETNSEMQVAAKIYQEWAQENGIESQSFMQLMAQFEQATLEAGRCTGSYDCQWPTTQCKNNRCVKPNGDSGQCNGSYDCKWPYSQCKNGFCERP